MADAKPDDIKDLLGGALFKALYKWMEETGPVYLLPTGPCLCCSVQHAYADMCAHGRMPPRPYWHGMHACAHLAARSQWCDIHGVMA